MPTEFIENPTTNQVLCTVCEEANRRTLDDSSSRKWIARGSWTRHVTTQEHLASVRSQASAQANEIELRTRLDLPYHAEPLSLSNEAASTSIHNAQDQLPIITGLGGDLTRDANGVSSADFDFKIEEQQAYFPEAVDEEAKLREAQLRLEAQLEWLTLQAVENELEEEDDNEPPGLAQSRGSAAGNL